MRPHDPHDRLPRRRCLPAFEGLESRDLPSTAPLSMQPVSPGPHTRVATAQAPPRPASQQLASAGQTAFPDPSVIANSIKLLYGPNSATPRNPTLKEVKRETFTAKWVGTYTVGTPRFDDRASTIHFFSKDGGSNQFLKGKMQMVLSPPADPNATPNPGNPFANQVTGIAGLFTQNFPQSGGLAILDVSGQPSPGAAPGDLPGHLNWTFDSFSSSGPYTAPSLDFNQGQGVVDIQYTPDRHPNPGSIGSGRMTVTFQGVINYSQIIANTGRPYN